MNVKDAVRRPAEVDANDWLAAHVVGFFNRINLLTETVRLLYGKAPVGTGPCIRDSVCDKRTVS